MQFKFCPTCGKLLTLKEAGDDGPTPYCGSCDKMWFDMFASCIIVLVANEYDEIALLHQPNLSERGVFVSGYITPGESAEEAAVREVKEELGLEIEALESTGTYWFQKQEQLMHGFIGRVKKRNWYAPLKLNQRCGYKLRMHRILCSWIGQAITRGIFTGNS